MSKYIPLQQLRKLRQTIILAKQHIDNLADRTGEIQKLFDTSIKPVMSVYQPILSSLSSHNSNLLYRARKCIDNKPFTDIRQLYNPLSPSGRAIASKSSPILYCSSSYQTSLSEIGAKIGDFVNIASFDYSDIMNGQFWFVGQLGSFYKSQEGTRYLKDINVIQNPFYTDQEVLNSLVYKDLLINELFSIISTPEDNYELNNFLINHIIQGLSKDTAFNGVIYVSTKDAPGINFAIYGDAINKLKSGIVNLIQITDIDDYGCFSHKLLESSKLINDKLNWSYH